MPFTPAGSRVWWLLAVLVPGVFDAGRASTPPSFNRDIKPILASRCFACHGADQAKRKGDLRLDMRDEAVAAGAIVPGRPEDSGLVQRVQSTDPDEVMPPPEKHQALTDAERSLLREWIAAGAPYEAHWAFIPPRVSLPANGDASLHPIDQFVRAPLSERGWRPAAEAPRDEWLRRVSVTLTGLPPTLAEREAFLADLAPGAHERVVDRLLASPHFGEQAAAAWLDAARYGDTYGRHEDADAIVWPWRDWVIRAFNDNLPYDQFITWQMAGDMLPGSTQDQTVATAFHRLPVQSNESGSDPEEFRWQQVFDRVNTTATAVMGLTLECARCHDHKYDPFTRKDYFRLAAYFNNIDELGLFSRYSNGVPAPSTFVYQPGEAERHASLKQAVAAAETALQEERINARARFLRWLESHAPPGCGPGLWERLSSTGASSRKRALLPKPDFYASFDYIDPASRKFMADSDSGIQSTSTVTAGSKPKGRFGAAHHFPKKSSFPKAGHFSRTQAFTFAFWLQCPDSPDKGVILHRSRAGLDAAHRGYEITFEDGRLTATLGHFYPGNALRVQLQDRLDFSGWRHVALTYDGSSRASGLRFFIDGRPAETTTIRDHLYKDIDYLKAWGDLDNAKVADADNGDHNMLTLGGRTLDSAMRSGALDELRVYDLALTQPEIGLLAGLPAERDESAWFDWYVREADAPCREAGRALIDARARENAFTIPLVELMVMREMPGARRPTPMLERGDFRQPGELVEPGVPESVLPGSSPPSPDRLGLAAWLTQPDHPLTSRVQVNRIWAQFFGRGLVPTPEDFGIQGSMPSHPELLDWLAVRFVESGWNVKALCREIVLSATFRQSSLPAEAAYREADPANALLARGPSFRLSAEQLRDAALASSGLLATAIGGPSVKPYQPAGLWEESGTQHVYVQDTGESLHRRSLYTFWRRTCPPPVMSVFDAPTREFCRVRRESSLTPLQALALMNDTTFLEAARVLAEDLVRRHPSPADQVRRVREAFLRLTSREGTAAEVSAMDALISEARQHFAPDAEGAAALLSATGEAPRDAQLDRTEVAATVLMTRALYNSQSFVYHR